LLALLVSCRPACIGLLALAAVQTSLTALDLTAWSCPLRRLTGLPCPGCGLSRACAALARGDVQEALTVHVFAFALPPLALLLAAGACLPARAIARLTAELACWERRTAIFWLVAGAYLAYYLVRIAFCRDHFLALVAG
jgi:hypothetical protein